MFSAVLAPLNCPAYLDKVIFAVRSLREAKSPAGQKQTDLRLSLLLPSWATSFESAALRMLLHVDITQRLQHIQVMSCLWLWPPGLCLARHHPSHA